MGAFRAVSIHFSKLLVILEYSKVICIKYFLLVYLFGSAGSEEIEGENWKNRIFLIWLCPISQWFAIPTRRQNCPVC